MSALLVVLALASLAGAGYVYTNPPVEEVPPEEFDVQQFEVTVEESAIVTGESPLYERGERLEGKPVYFANVTPELQLSIVADVPDDRSVEVSNRLLVDHRGEFNGEPFWEQQEVIVADESTVTDGELRTNATIDVTELWAEVAGFDTAMAGIGQTSTRLQVTTTYSTDAEGGGTYEGELTASAPIEITEVAYWIEDDMTDSGTHSQTTEPQIRQQPPNVELAGGLAGLSLLLLLAAGGLLVWRSREADVYELELEVIRSRYDEWISEGEFPTGSDKQYVYINSLEDLVDVAIDTNKRVIYDPDLETYSVVDSDIVYYHATDPSQIGSWLGLSEGS